ncbi:MAG: YciI family protein [Gammaproteobacteria bacterium]
MSAKKKSAQFLLIICHDDDFVPTDALIAEIGAWIRKMEKQGIRRYGNPLRPAAEATTVRVRNGKRVLKNGPFENSREKICAYELIECADLEQAVELTTKHPMAKIATIEVRPVWTDLAS